MRLGTLAACLSAFALPACNNSTSGTDLAGSPDMAIAGPQSLVLLYTNDEHSHLFAFGPEADDHPTATMAGTGALKGGIARRKVILDTERAAAKTAGADVLTVSAGDNAMGTLTQVSFTTSSSDYAALQALGYDITCLGNHEFDFGPAALARSITAIPAGKPLQIVNSNIRFSGSDPADDSLAALYGEGTSTKPIKRYHVITTPSGLKVGFLGIVGSEAAYQAPFKAPVLFSGEAAEEPNFAVVRPKIYAAIQPVVDALRNTEKVDLVVALSHSGLNLEHPELGDDYNIAQNVSGIDVIISGHSHTVVPAPLSVANTKTSRNVIIVQAGSYGAFVGRLKITRPAPGMPFTLDAPTSKLLPVDDTTVPDKATAGFIDNVVRSLETPSGGTPAFLESALTHVLGAKTSSDPLNVGGLYFYKLGTTSFSIPGVKRFVETNVLDLSADSEYAAVAGALPMELPDVAVQASGVVRADIDQGKSGALTFGDAFRVFPLGSSPADGSIGYPVVHAYLFLAELKGALEFGASLGLTNDAFYLGVSGIRVTVDTTRPAFDGSSQIKALDPNNGRVTKIEFDSQHRVGAEQYDTILFDVNRQVPDAWTSANYNALSLIHVATNIYIATFATSAGVTLKDKAGQKLALTDAIVHRGDGTEVKDYEAFAAWLKKQADGNGGKLPDRYNPATPAGKLPRRTLCTGPLCGTY